MHQPALRELHKQMGARFTSFAGLELVLAFSRVPDEHQTVRTALGLFDVSHLGRLTVKGPGATALLQRLATNDLARLEPGSAQYSLFLTTQGGVMDDIVINRLEPEAYLVCVNAANLETDLRWLREKAPESVAVRDTTAETVQLALQGPKALECLSRMAEGRLDDLKPWRFRTTRLAGTEALVSRTGYTGEDGFELYLASDQAPAVWTGLLERGRDLGLAPCGLGARDTLRLEMGYPLHGHDMHETTSPLEAGLERFVKLEKGEFIGREALRAQLARGLAKRLVGFELREEGIPRKGCRITSNGQEVGVVTSGNFSPTLKKGIGLGYVPADVAHEGTGIVIAIRGRSVPATVMACPLYRRR